MSREVERWGLCPGPGGLRLPWWGAGHCWESVWQGFATSSINPFINIETLYHPFIISKFYIFYKCVKVIRATCHFRCCLSFSQTI